MRDARVEQFARRPETIGVDPTYDAPGRRRCSAPDCFRFAHKGKGNGNGSQSRPFCEAHGKALQRNGVEGLVGPRGRSADRAGWVRQRAILYLTGRGA